MRRSFWIGKRRYRSDQKRGPGAGRAVALLQSGRYQAVRARADATGKGIIRVIEEEFERGQLGDVAVLWDELLFYSNVLWLAEAVADRSWVESPPVRPKEEDAEPEKKNHYVVSSWFLADCAQYLVGHSQGDEVLHLVTGSRIAAQTRTLDRMIKVPLDVQSPVFAQAAHQDLQRLLIELDSWGHSLHGLFHSHPGTGVQATNPSGIDLETHERYERGGYPLIGAIFTKDGFVRFFAGVPFEVTVFGKGVKRYDPHIFKIQRLTGSKRDLPHETFEVPGQRF